MERQYAWKGLGVWLASRDIAWFSVAAASPKNRERFSYTPFAMA